MNKFTPFITDDGSLSLINHIVDDVYHSSVGAYKESVEKFIKPSKIAEFAKLSDEVNILDVCYGMGYNTIAAINEISKVNSNCKINIYALEIDISVLAFSLFVNFPEVNNDFIDSLKSALINLNEIKHEHYNLSKKFNLAPYDSLLNHKTGTFVHNIYYRTLSSRNDDENLNYKIPIISLDYKNLININLLIGDARNTVSLIEKKIDYIFLDAFTPAKLPTLWSVEFFIKLHNLLSINGNLSTYSAASPVRSGLREAGFFLGKSKPVGRNSYGTIAYKNNSFIDIPLDNVELEILETNAGIPYNDTNLNWSKEEIINYRGHLLKNSKRQSTSSYFKKLNKI